MSEGIDSRKVFMNLRNTILNKKSHGEVDKNSDVITIAFSNLTYSMTSDKTENITFSILNLNLVLNSDGAILLMELEPGGVEFYEIENEPLERKLYQHLIWRAELLKDFEI